MSADNGSIANILKRCLLMDDIIEKKRTKRSPSYNLGDS